MAWHDFGNGAGNWQSDDTVTLFNDALPIIMHELTAAIHERQVILGQTPTKYYIGVGGQKANPSAVDFSGMWLSGESLVKENIERMRSAINSLVVGGYGIAFVVDEYPYLTRYTIESLLQSGSYGSSWVSVDRWQNPSIYFQIKEACDALHTVTWALPAPAPGQRDRYVRVERGPNLVDQQVWDTEIHPDPAWGDILGPPFMAQSMWDTLSSLCGEGIYDDSKIVSVTGYTPPIQYQFENIFDFGNAGFYAGVYIHTRPVVYWPTNYDAGPPWILYAVMVPYYQSYEPSVSERTIDTTGIIGIVKNSVLRFKKTIKSSSPHVYDGTVMASYTGGVDFYISVGGNNFNIDTNPPQDEIEYVEMDVQDWPILNTENCPAPVVSMVLPETLPCISNIVVTKTRTHPLTGETVTLTGYNPRRDVAVGIALMCNKALHESTRTTTDISSALTYG